MTEAETAEKPLPGESKKRLIAALAPPSAAATLLGVVSALDQLFQHPATGNYVSLWPACATTLLLTLGVSAVRGLARRKRQGRPISAKRVALFAVTVAICLGTGFTGGRFLFQPAYDAGSRPAPPAPSATPAALGSSPSPSSSTAAPVPTTFPSQPRTPPTTAAGPSPTTQPRPTPPAPTGHAHVSAAGDRPGGCNTQYVVSGGTDGDPATTGKALWLVTLLLADDANGNKDHFYAKAPVGDSFSATIGANTDSGARNSRFLLVAADTSADAELRANYESDRYHTGDYPDSRRESLPAGSVVVAETPSVGQRC
ncbi:hypothetical protein ACIRSS_26445 [Amycolatopsis sp. NPDC101161]|uniref:hypothetical protein n=1 Tax=Amycolatopsis sp. NPDC101161 TaxID=3363940 RepID=UPI00381FB0BB